MQQQQYRQVTIGKVTRANKGYRFSICVDNIPDGGIVLFPKNGKRYLNGWANMAKADNESNVAFYLAVSIPSSVGEEQPPPPQKKEWRPKEKAVQDNLIETPVDSVKHDQTPF